MFSNIPRIKIYKISKLSFCLEESGCWNLGEKGRVGVRLRKEGRKQRREGERGSAGANKAISTERRAVGKSKTLKLETPADGIQLLKVFRNHLFIFLTRLI